MTTQEIIQAEKESILQTFVRPDFVLTHGKGVYLYDKDGNSYLDCVAGIAVNAFGYADEEIQRTLIMQAQRLWHVSNLYYTEPQVALAKLLVENTFADKVFFSNSGTEAVDGAIKFARKWGFHEKGADAFEIISFNRSFHGRTYAGLSATGQPKFWEEIGPILPGFVFGDFNDLESVKKLVNEKTCAIIVEPVQGEGGIYPADKDFLQGIRKICDENNVLLIFDEIQCGFGRTGVFCSYESYGIKPDIMTVAKPIANGLPMGSILLNDKVAQFIKLGDHGSTFGGNPLVTAVAENVLARILAPGFLAEVQKKGDYFIEKLKSLQAKNDKIIEIRGRGLMIGVELSCDPADLIKTCAKNGLLIAKASGSAIRFLPPLIISEKQIDEALEKFEQSLKEVA